MRATSGAPAPSKAVEPRPGRPPGSRMETGAPVLPRRRRARTGARVVLLQVVVGLVFLAAWETATSLKLINPILFSKPSAIAERILSFVLGESVYSRTIYDHLATTLSEMAIGYALGAGAGLVLGFALARSRLFSRVLEPYILAIYSVPKIALAPLFVLILGIGFESKVGVVAMEVFFLVFFNTLAGVLAINEEFVNLARIMGASGAQVARRVILPAALPSILVGLKMGVPFAMIGAIIGEFIASTHGLGWLILYSSANFDASALFAAMAFLVAVVRVLGRLLAFFEGRMLRWRPSREREAVQI